MKLFKRVAILDAKEDEAQYTETPILEKDIINDDLVHVCYHDEGKGRPCKLIKIKK